MKEEEMMRLPREGLGAETWGMPMKRRWSKDDVPAKPTKKERLIKFYLKPSKTKRDQCHKNPGRRDHLGRVLLGILTIVKGTTVNVYQERREGRGRGMEVERIGRKQTMNKYCCNSHLKHYLLLPKDICYIIIEM